MEVVSLFTSEIEILKLVDEFIYGYSELKFSNKDGDTVYFKSKQTDKTVVCYHFKTDNVEGEFVYSYKPKDVAFIKYFIQGKEIFLIDIYFKNQDNFNELMNSFKVYLKSRNNEPKSELILSELFIGLIEFDTEKVPLSYNH